MADLLVPLYGLRDVLVPHCHEIRRPMASEGTLLQEWVSRSFGEGWASEILPGLSRTPPTVMLAVESGAMSPAGFCAWDCTALGFLGPVGVLESSRGDGIGGALVLSVLHEMARQGYGYAVIGGVGPVRFFQKVCGAVEIQGSTPGIYGKRLRW